MRLKIPDLLPPTCLESNHQKDWMANSSLTVTKYTPLQCERSSTEKTFVHAVQQRQKLYQQRNSEVHADRHTSSAPSRQLPAVSGPSLYRSVDPTVPRIGNAKEPQMLHQRYLHGDMRNTRNSNSSVTSHWSSSILT